MTEHAMRQDTIRQWARARNLAVGHRGRLPQSLIEAYQKETADLTDSSDHLQSREQPAGSMINRYEPFSDYLELCFGSSYDAVGDTWTPELAAAVKEYLLHEVTDDDFVAILEEAGGGSSDDRAEQAAWIIDHHEPWKVADVFHLIAVTNALTLRAVLAQRPDYLNEKDLAYDGATWLDAHATYDQLKALAQSVGLAGEIPTALDFSGWLYPGLVAREQLTDLLVDSVPPNRLADAWDDTIGPGPTDLTDEEWELLAPFLPRDPGRPQSTPQRQAINGMLYQQAHPEKRRGLPLRYGRRNLLRQRKLRYRKIGVLTTMLTSLEDKPEAARIVAWLRSELEAPGRATKGQS